MEHGGLLIRRKKIYGAAAWIMTGMLLLCAAFFTYANDYKCISFSIANNDIYDVNEDVFSLGTLEGRNYSIRMPVDLEHDNEKYLRIIAKGITREDTAMHFIAYSCNENGEYVPAEIIKTDHLHNGENDFKLSSADFSFVEIDIYGENEIVLKGVQFRESIKRVSFVGALPLLGVTLLVFLLLTGGLLLIQRRCCRNKLESNNKGDVIQFKYSLLKNVTLPNLSLAIPLIFFVIITISLMLIKNGESAYRNHFHYYLNAELLLTLLTVVFMYSTSQKNSEIKLDKTAFITCTCLMLYMLLSDSLVDKVYRFSGIELYMVLLLFACVWNSRTNREKYIKDYEIAVHAFLAFLVLLSVIHRNEPISGRFSGPLDNPSIYALDLCAIWAVLLGSMESNIVHNSGRTIVLIISLEMIATGGLLFASHSITPTIAAIFVTALWFFRYIARKKGIKQAVVIAVMTLTLFFLGLVGLILYVRSAGLQSSSRIIMKLDSASITTLLSGRNYYWKEYLREMNVLGHTKRPFMWDHRILPHNAVISMMYWYGVPCVIPYIIMMMMAVEKTWRYANSNLEHSAIPFYSVVSFIIMSFADNVEQPFVWLPWISCYLLMAPLLAVPNEDLLAMQTKQH